MTSNRNIDECVNEFLGDSANHIENKEEINDLNLHNEQKESGIKRQRYSGNTQINSWLHFDAAQNIIYRCMEELKSKVDISVIGDELSQLYNIHKRVIHKLKTTEQSIKYDQQNNNNNQNLQIEDVTNQNLDMDSLDNISNLLAEKSELENKLEAIKNEEKHCERDIWIQRLYEIEQNLNKIAVQQERLYYEFQPPSYNTTSVVNTNNKDIIIEPNLSSIISSTTTCTSSSSSSSSSASFPLFNSSYLSLSPVYTPVSLSPKSEIEMKFNAELKTENDYDTEEEKKEKENNRGELLSNIDLSLSNTSTTAKPFISNGNINLSSIPRDNDNNNNNNILTDPDLIAKKIQDQIDLSQLYSERLERAKTELEFYQQKYNEDSNQFNYLNESNFKKHEIQQLTESIENCQISIDRLCESNLIQEQREGEEERELREKRRGEEENKEENRQRGGEENKRERVELVNDLKEQREVLIRQFHYLQKENNILRESLLQLRNKLDKIDLELKLFE